MQTIEAIKPKNHDLVRAYGQYAYIGQPIDDEKFFAALNASGYESVDFHFNSPWINKLYLNGHDQAVYFVEFDPATGVWDLTKPNAFYYKKVDSILAAA